MHPEIRKFWEDAGYTVMRCDDLNVVHSPHEMWCAGWIARGINDLYIATSATIHGNNKPDKIFYNFDNLRMLSEEEMLRIIKLKAFV
jgi:hypothetical protein